METDGPKVHRLPRWPYTALALVVPDLRELYELRAQTDRPYRFSGKKAEDAFDLTPTSLREGLRETMAWLAEE